MPKGLKRDAKTRTAKPKGFDQPHDLTGGDTVLGLGWTDVQKHMPAMADIPAEFKDRNDRHPCVKIQREWFFNGLKKWTLTPKPGIDHKKALAHLAAIQASWDCQHEHKEAAVAYLMSLWYETPKEGVR